MRNPQVANQQRITGAFSILSRLLLGALATPCVGDGADSATLPGARDAGTYFVERVVWHYLAL